MHVTGGGVRFTSEESGTVTTVEVILEIDEPDQEEVIGALLDWHFEGFLQEEHRLRAFIPTDRWNEQRRRALRQWLRRRGLEEALDERTHAPQNWNAAWEATIRPLPVGPFLIKPTWAAVPDDAVGKQVLEIDPKLSFGTGYHASTRLALHLLARSVQGGEQVLDAGTGTGILAIAALRLGAARAIAFDTDRWAQENAVENFHQNHVADKVTFRPGSMEVVSEIGFDLILANINRAVLLGMLPAFRAKLVPGGRLILSGLLQSDRDRMLEAATEMGLQPVADRTEAEWWAVLLQLEA